MAHRISAILARGSFWRNFQLRPQLHNEQVCAYRITHVHSGRTYLGWCGNTYRGLAVIGSKLANGTYAHLGLQALQNEHPGCDLEVWFPSILLSQQQREAAAKAKVREWKKADGAVCLQYVAPKPRKPAQRLKLSDGRTFEELEVDDLIPVRRCGGQLHIPPVDFLHRAWHGSGV